MIHIGKPFLGTFRYCLGATGLKIAKQSEFSRKVGTDLHISGLEPTMTSTYFVKT